MKPISKEDRERIIKHNANGESGSKISKLLMIGVSTVYQILSLYRQRGSIEAKPYKGNNRKITTEQDKEIRRIIGEKPDITLNKLIETLDLKVSESGLSKHLKKMGLTYKKNDVCQRTATRRCCGGKKPVAGAPKKNRYGKA